LKNQFSYIKKTLLLLPRQDVPKIIGIFFLLLTSIAFEVGTVATIIPILNSFFGKSELMLINISFQLTELIVFLIVFFTLKYATLFASVYFQSKYIFNLQRVLSMMIFQQYIKQEIGDERVNSSIMIRNIVTEVNQFVSGAVLPVILLATELGVALFISFFVVYMLPSHSWIIFLVLGFSSYMYMRYSKKKVIGYGLVRQMMEAERIKIIQEAFNSFREIKIYQKENLHLLNYEKSNSESAEASRHTYNYMNSAKIWLEMSILLALIYLVYTWTDGMEVHEVISIFSVIVMASFRLLPSASRIITQNQTFQYNFPTIDVLTDLKIHKINDSIRRQNFSFEYDLDIYDLEFRYKDQIIFSGLSFHIQKGDKILIKGKSGTGKSTLIDIVLGFRKPYKGKVTSKNKDIFDYRDSWWRRISYIPQEPSLFDDTILSNIRFDSEEKKLNKPLLARAIKVSGLDFFFNNGSFNLDTLINERGSRLSGGQKQRIVLARAIYKNPKLLIMDESTSALDEQSELQIYDNICREFPDMTVLAISHRKSIASKFNKIINLDDYVR